MIKIIKEIYAKFVIENSIFIKFFMLDNNKLTININRFLDLKVLEIKFIFVKNLYKNKEMKKKSSKKYLKLTKKK
jgi:hypothetical protein